MPACMQDTKRARLTYFDGDSDTDESDAEDMPAAGAASAAAAPPEPAAAPAPAALVTVPSGGHAAPSTGPAQVTCLPLRKPTCTSAAEEPSTDAGHMLMRLPAGCCRRGWGPTRLQQRLPP
jgi:hypothetical protein